MKIRPVGAYRSTRTDGRTKRQDEANSRFLNFAKAPKNIFNVIIGIKYRTAGVLTQHYIKSPQ